MEPRPLPQSWSSPTPPTIAHCNGTLQWHHVHSAKVGHHPPLQPTIAHYNGTLQWHPAMAPCSLNHSTLQWQHHVHCTLQWHPGATSNAPKWFVALPPIGSKNPYSYRYLGKKDPCYSIGFLQFNISFFLLGSQVSKIPPIFRTVDRNPKKLPLYTMNSLLIIHFKPCPTDFQKQKQKKIKP